MAKRVALAGRIRAGKDYVAGQLPFTKVSLSTPLEQLIRIIFGEVPRNSLGYRQLQQKIGQYGRGIINQDYPLSPERFALTEAVRRIGPSIWDAGKVDWKRFGVDPKFWTYYLHQVPPVHNPNPRCEDRDLVLTNARLEADFEDLEERGWDIYLVLCTWETRYERLEQLGERPDRVSDIYDPREEHDHVDISEKVATFAGNSILYTDKFGVDPDWPLDRVIWNDDRDPPGGSILARSTGWLTTEDFVRTVGQTSAPVNEGKKACPTCGC